MASAVQITLSEEERRPSAPGLPLVVQRRSAGVCRQRARSHVNAGVVWCPGWRPLIGHFIGRVLRDTCARATAEGCRFAGGMPARGSANGTERRRRHARDGARCGLFGAARMRPVGARPAAVAVGRVGRAATGAQCGARFVLVAAARPGDVQVAAQEHRAARQGGHLRGGDRLLARRGRLGVGAQRTGRARRPRGRRRRGGSTAGDRCRRRRRARGRTPRRAGSAWSRSSRRRPDPCSACVSTRCQPSVGSSNFGRMSSGTRSRYSVWPAM